MVWKNMEKFCNFEETNLKMSSVISLEKVLKISILFKNILFGSFSSRAHIFPESLVVNSNPRSEQGLRQRVRWVRYAYP
jgi:hypothetical protein